MAEMVRQGVRLLGGCCGTTPAHIQEFRKTLKIKAQTTGGQGQPGEEAGRCGHAGRDQQRTSADFLSGLQEDRMPILVEIDPPTHLDIDHLMNGARALAAAGVDAISLGENPLAILRAGNLGLASRIKEETGVQTIIHQTGRDLNALALQSRLMEAHILGIEAVLAVTGDSASATDQPGVSGIFDLDSFGLIRMINRLNHGSNLAGQSIRGETDFSIGAAFSFRPQNPDLQIGRLEKKAALGARFAMTQPLFSRQAVEQMMERVGASRHADFSRHFPADFGPQRGISP